MYRMDFAEFHYTVNRRKTNVKNHSSSLFRITWICFRNQDLLLKVPAEQNHFLFCRKQCSTGTLFRCISQDVDTSRLFLA